MDEHDISSLIIAVRLLGLSVRRLIDAMDKTYPKMCGPNGDTYGEHVSRRGIEDAEYWLTKMQEAIDAMRDGDAE